MPVMIALVFLGLAGYLAYALIVKRSARAELRGDFRKQPLTTTASIAGMISLAAFFIGVFIPRFFHLGWLAAATVAMIVGLWADKRNL